MGSVDLMALMADRRTDERRTRKTLPPSLDDVEAAYHVLGSQTRYGDFVEALVERVAALFKARACAFADRLSGHTWRYDAGDYEVRLDQPIANVSDVVGLCTGSGCDLNAPFFDGDAQYVLLALERHEMESYGWLYLYGPAEFGSPERQRFEALVAYATVVLQNIRFMEDSDNLARTDALTGLPNRRALQSDLLDRLAKRAPFCYVFMDLDHFKEINDTLGHDKGDEALQRFADALRSAARRNDIVGRLGGDEFVALLDGSAAEGFISRVRETIHPQQIETSVGVARYPVDADSASALHKLADGRLYEVKRARPSRR